MQDELRLKWEMAGGKVPPHWHFVTIENLLATPKSIAVGVMYPGTNTEGGVPLTKVSDVKNGRIVAKPDFLISTEKDEEYKRTRLQGGELLVTLVGNPGDCVLVTEEMIGWNVARAIAALRLKNPELRKWIRYVFLSAPAQNFLDARLNTTVQKTLNLKDIRELALPVPPDDERVRITGVIETIDDKIEVNRQMNTTLEAMAQALFKSWFVDFDPVIDNALSAGNSIPEPLQARAEMRKALGDQRKPLPAEIQRQFPSRFVFTEEMGWVPEGWEVGAFRDIAVHIRDNVKAEVVGDFDFYIGLEHIGRKQLFLTESGTGDSIESNKSQFAEYDLLFGKLRPYFHKVCIAPQEGICSTDILVFRAKQPSLHAFMTMTAFRDEFVEYADIRSTGTRMPRANAKDMLAYPIIIPSAPLMAEFEKMVSLHWVRGMQSANESHELAKLRDALLPKLLSGQLRIPEAEAMIERAGVAV